MSRGDVLFQDFTKEGYSAITIHYTKHNKIMVTWNQGNPQNGHLAVVPIIVNTIRTRQAYELGILVLEHIEKQRQNNVKD